MKAIHWLTTLSRVKQHLNKSNATNDAYLESLISVASKDIESYTNRQLRVRTYGANGLDAERHNGDGANKLYARQYPIVSVTSLHDDVDRDFTSTTLKAATEYMIWKDEGIVQLYSDSINGSTFATGIANLQLIYTAGYGTLEIIDGVNDKLCFTDADTTDAIVEIAEGIYTPEDLASALETGIAAVSNSHDHTVRYDQQTSTFIITRVDTTLVLNWTNASLTDRSIGKTLGFDISADDVNAATHTSDYSVLAVPADLEMACIQLVMRYYKEGTLGADRLDKISTSTGGGGANAQITYSQEELPISVKRILGNYIRPVASV